MTMFHEIKSISKEKVLDFFIYLTQLGLRCFAGALSSPGEQGILLATVRSLLMAVISLVAEAEHGI